MKSLPKVVISFDFELGWGALDTELWRTREAAGVYTDLRPVLAELFEQLGSYQLPTTWAMVAGMLVEEHEFNHLPDTYRSSATRFIREANCTTVDARDILEKWPLVERYSEISSHSYSHVYANYPGCTEDSFVRDIDMSLKVLNSYFGITVDSLIFPRDQSRYIEIVEDSLKLNTRVSPHVENRAFSVRVRNAIEEACFGAPYSNVIVGNNSTIRQSGSFYYNWVGGRFELIKKNILSIHERRILNSSGENSPVFHIWLHPYNISESSEVFSRFKKFLLRLADLRDRQIIDVCTMGQVVREAKK